jgi:hypothetical protein
MIMDDDNQSNLVLEAFEYQFSLFILILPNPVLSFKLIVLNRL